MIRDLSAEQWRAVTEGRLDGPDGRSYTRRGTRGRRSAADAWITAGAPLVVYRFGAGRLDWHEGPEAAARWAELRRDVTTAGAGPARKGQPLWHAGRWEADDGTVLVVLTAHC